MSSIQQDQNEELNRINLALEDPQFVHQENQINNQIQNQKNAETLGNQKPQVAEIFNVINVEQNFEDHFQKLESLGEDSDKNEKETIIGCWLHGIRECLNINDNIKKIDFNQSSLSTYYKTIEQNYHCILSKDEKSKKLERILWFSTVKFLYLIQLQSKCVQNNLIFHIVMNKEEEQFYKPEFKGLKVGLRKTIQKQANKEHYQMNEFEKQFESMKIYDDKYDKYDNPAIKKLKSNELEKKSCNSINSYGNSEQPIQQYDDFQEFQQQDTNDSSIYFQDDHQDCDDQL